MGCVQCLLLISNSIRHRAQEKKQSKRKSSRRQSKEEQSRKRAKSSNWPNITSYCIAHRLVDYLLFNLLFVIWLIVSEAQFFRRFYSAASIDAADVSTADDNRPDRQDRLSRGGSVLIVIL